MSADRDMGGPAFPTCFATPHDFPDGSKLPLGMTLRDYFATQALPAVFTECQRLNAETKSLCMSYREIAIESYSMADAMLTARKEAST